MSPIDTRNISVIGAGEGNKTATPFYYAVFTPERQPGTVVLNVLDGEAANDIWNLEICYGPGGEYQLADPSVNAGQ